MENLSDLVGDLSDAINQALGRSTSFLNAAAALEEALGDYRISIDLLLPQAAGRTNSKPALAVKPTQPDRRLPRLIKLK